MTEPKLSGGRSEPQDWLEVRLLGPLRVWRADGSCVQDRDWRTNKNADLLRWLALHAGDPVPVDALLAGLWPEADGFRARASLRTAVSHLRKVLDADVVTRGSSDVTLTSAWVDAIAFADLAAEVKWRRREGLPAEALAAAREADALYTADLPAEDGAPAPIVQQSASLSTMHRQLLEDAAELSVELGWMRDAVGYASRLLEIDPVSELATRTLMIGYAGMGELHHALQAYERCRRVLAEELGVDPSPQTRAVHLQVLRPPLPSRPSSVLVGRDSEVEWLTSVLSQAMGAARQPGPPRLVLLAGHPGSGRRRLARDVCHSAGIKLYDVGTRPELLADGEDDTVLLWEPDLSADLGLLEKLLARPELVAGYNAVLVVVPLPGVDANWDRLPRGEEAVCLELKPLLRADLARLASHLLGGPVTAELVDELVVVSGGLPGGAAAMVRHWAAAGRLLATATGLALTPTMSGAETDQAVRKVLARALPRLEGDCLEALLLTSVLDQPISPTLLAGLLPDEGGPRRARATAALEKLVDLGLMRMSPAGAVWRHPLLRDAAYGWMRPAVRRRVHLRIAEQAPIPSEARIRHWLAGGERALACSAALEAAKRCSARGDHAAARTYLLEVCSLGDVPETGAAERIDSFERLGDACALVRRPDEARSAYMQALDIARAHGLPHATRLSRKVEAASDPRALDPAPAHRLPGSSATTGSPAVAGSAVGAELEGALLEAVDQADRGGDAALRIDARLRLAADVCLPRRQFEAADRWVEEALKLSRHPLDEVRATMVRQLPSVLLGGARAVGQALEDASATAEGAGDHEAWWRLLGLRVLVAHDLGDSAFERLWPRLRDRVITTGPVDPLVPELATIGLRVMVERGLVDSAASMAHHLAFAGGQRTTLMEHLARIAMADLAEASLEPRRAAELLRSVLEEGTSSGCVLLVPEAAARFVILQAAHDVAAADAALETFRRVVQAQPGGPREEVWGRLAQAAVLAGQSDRQGAAAASGEAVALATQHGLEPLAVRARDVHTGHLHATLPRQASVIDERTVVTRW